MSIQNSSTLRTALASSYASTIGTAGVLKIFTGSPPGGCASADSGTLLVTINLPNPAFTSSAGSDTLTGTWSGVAAGVGTAGYYRMYDGSANCHEQGTVTMTGSGGDMTLNNNSIASGQTVTVTGFTRNFGSA